jgi:dipeptidyl aminopeptidase/acylaminoacyl peptidase
MPERRTRAYGLWESPITPISLARGKRLSEVCFDDATGAVVWLEGRSDRGVLVVSDPADPAPRDLTDELSVRATVGYGGGDVTAGHGAVFFVSGGRLYRQELAGGEARAITPALGEISSPALSPDGRWLLFVQSYERVDAIGVVDSEGREWPAKLVSGRDFFMQPRWSPDGRHVAWIAWDHPQMPWDGTELWLAEIDDAGALPRLRYPRCLAGGTEVAVLQPEFTPAGRAIVYVSDEGGLGQIYLQPLDGGDPRRLTPGDLEYGKPAWMHNRRIFALVGGGEAVACVGSEGGMEKLRLVEVDSGAVHDIAAARELTSVEFVAGAPKSRRIAVVGSSSTQPARVIELDLDAESGRTVARSSSETVPAGALSVAEPISWTSFDGEPAYGLFYPPASARFTSPGLPPLVVLVHGGPTSQAVASFNSQAQFLATRGYAVLLVNYRGSTGYGRGYMLKLRRSWGIYDVEDARSGCLYLAEQGAVDPRRRVIMGGSAGGFTVLQSLVAYPGFYTAGICMYGVSNQFTLASDTHKFEERYLDSMLGPLPEAAGVYRERSPIFHAEQIRDPLAVFQGDIDRVVPRAQSDEIVASLRARGVPHEYHVYEGEGHGWRKSETIEQFYASVDRFLRQYVVYA